MSARWLYCVLLGTTSRLHIAYHKHCAYSCGTLQIADSEGIPPIIKGCRTVVLGQKAQNL